MAKDNSTTGEVELTSMQTRSHAQATDAVPNWRPRSFRWYSIAVPLTLNLLLVAFAVVLLPGMQSNAIEKTMIFSSESVVPYILWQMGPVAIAVAAWMCWEIIYIDICRFEPFHRMTQPGGVTVKESLNIDWATTFTPIVPFVALGVHAQKNYTVALASIIYMLSSTFLPISTAAMFTVVWDDNTTYTNEDVLIDLRYPFIYCTLIISGLIIIGGFVLLYILGKRQTRLYGNPIGIGGIAALISGSDLLDKFKSIRSYDTNARIDEVLGPYHIQLIHKDGHDNPYQICLIDPQENHPIPRERPFAQTRIEAHSFWLLGRSFLLVWAVSTIPTFLYLGNILENATIDVVLIKIGFTLAMIIKATLASNWQLKLGIMEPFYRLKSIKKKPPTSHDPYSSSLNLTKESAEALNLRYSGPPILGIYHAMRRGSKSVSMWFVSLYVFLLQLFVIYAPSMVNNQILWYMKENTYYSDDSQDDGVDVYDPTDYSDDSLQMPLGIKVNYYLVLTGAVIQAIFWLYLIALILGHKRKPILPRRPHTLSSVILYLCHSKHLLEDLRGTSTMSTVNRDALLAECERNYAFGWIQPENDGFYHAAIERVEDIKNPYEYGGGFQNAR